MKLADLEKKYSKRLKTSEYSEFDRALEIGLQVAEARIRKGLTQKQLAKKIGTKQPGIARIENGFSLASNTFLLKIAKALKVKFILPKFDFQTEINLSTKTTENSLAQTLPNLDDYLSAQYSSYSSMPYKYN